MNIRDTLQELRAWSKKLEVVMSRHASADQQIFLVNNWSEVLVDIGDKQCILSSLKESAYFSSFSDRSTVFEKKLSYLTKFIELLHDTQKKWIFLEPLFSNGAIPNEKHIFCQIDEVFRDTMGRIKEEPRLFSFVDYAINLDLCKTLSNVSQQIERCQRALIVHLEEKRSNFPRFYFLCDEELLELLGQCREVHIIHKHLLKLFQAIYEIKVDDKHFITEMRSIDGEVVYLEKVN